jgi:hypothetical protein
VALSLVRRGKTIIQNFVNGFGKGGKAVKYRDAE